MFGSIVVFGFNWSIVVFGFNWSIVVFGFNWSIVVFGFNWSIVVFDFKWSIVVFGFKWSIVVFGFTGRLLCLALTGRLLCSALTGRLLCSALGSRLSELLREQFPRAFTLSQLMCDAPYHHVCCLTPGGGCSLPHRNGDVVAQPLNCVMTLSSLIQVLHTVVIPASVVFTIALS